jgi:ribosomal-protein-alanine N-acetyltransferase
METSQVKNPPLDVHIRWLIMRDYEEVLEIEKQSFEYPWSREDLASYLRNRANIGMVAELRGSKEDNIVGFMVYELKSSSIRLDNIAVARGFRRRGVGSQMLKNLILKLSTQRRKTISVRVSEKNLEAQLFFKENGFRALKVLHNVYDPGFQPLDSEGKPYGAYLMEYLKEKI